MFIFSQRANMDGSGLTVRIKLPDPSRIKNEPVRDAIVLLGTMDARRRDLNKLGAAAETELRDIDALIAVEADKELDGKKNALAVLLAKKIELEEAVGKFETLRPRMNAKVGSAAGAVVKAWTEQRGEWTRALAQEARDHSVALVTLATTLGRLSEDLDSTLGVLAGYESPKAAGAIAAHMISLEIGQARAALGAAIAKLTDAGLI